MNKNKMSAEVATAKAGSTPFEIGLRNQIRKYIRTAKQDGTTAMGVDCLKQCVRPPGQHLDGAPMGTNVQYLYAEIFRNICRNTPDISAFTY